MSEDPDCPVDPAHPIACSLDALTQAERRRRAQLARGFAASIRAVTELPDGYAFSIAPDVPAAELRELIELEKRCCPFLTIELLGARAQEETVVGMTGGPGVKEYLRAQLAAPLTPRAEPRA